MKIRIALLTLSLLANASCTGEGAYYCPAEDRDLSENEWKLRALVAIERERLKEVGSLISDKDEHQIREEKEAFLTANPDCCEIDFGDKYGLIESKQMAVRDRVKERNITVQANLYMGVGTAAAISECASEAILLSQG